MERESLADSTICAVKMNVPYPRITRPIAKMETKTEKKEDLSFNWSGRPGWRK